LVFSPLQEGSEGGKAQGEVVKRERRPG